MGRVRWGIRLGAASGLMEDLEEGLLLNKLLPVMEVPINS